MLAGIRNTPRRPAPQKEAILPEDLIAMLETLDRGTLRGLRDRAMLLLGFAGGLRRSEIVGLDLARDQTEDGRGWVEMLDKGVLVTLRGKTGWREVEIGRGSSDATCPVVASQTWLRLARIAHGPLFRRVTGQGKRSAPIGSTIRRWPGWSSARPSPPACAAISRRVSAARSFPDIHCALAWPPRPKSTSDMCRSSSAMPRRK